MNKILIDYLERLELTDIEAKLYTGLLESGEITVRELARKTGIGRTSAYPYIALLIEKGLIVKMVKGSHTYVCLLYTSPSPRDGLLSRMPSSA